MDAVERLAARLVCEDSLLDFTRYMFKARNGSPFIVAPHLERIAGELQGLVDGTLPDKPEILIINIPPRYGKTELAVINFMAWCFARNPACKFIHLSYADKLVLDNSAQTRELVKHEAYRALWQLDFKQDADAKGLWKTEAGGGLMASPAGGTITGFGAGSTELGCYGPRFAGAIIIDDPLKPDDANSPVERDNVNQRLINTVISRRNSRETPIILIMQRLHEEDMTGFVLAGKTGLRVRHVKLPALRPDGTALWPHKHTAAELLAMKASAPMMFAGQMQQEPAPEEGSYFKREWFKEYDTPPARLKKYGASDFAVSDGEGDWTVHLVIGVDEFNDIYVLDVWRERISPDVWIERLLDMAHAQETTAWAIEKGVIERSIGALLTRRMNERKQWPYIVKYASIGGKEERAQSIRGRMAARGLYLPKSKAWVADLIHECLRFPKGSHDDQVDTLGLIGRMLAGMQGAEPLPVSRPYKSYDEYTVKDILGELE